MKNIKLSLLLLFLVFGQGCSIFQRSAESGYGGQDAKKETAQKVQTSVDDLEKTLKTQKEKEQYARVLPWLKDDSEKIEMLSLKSTQQRQNWIIEKNIWQRAQRPSEGQKKLIQNNDIGLGMPMDFVRQAWGEPQSIEVSGNPALRNERWRYSRQVSTADGFKQEKRFVYFENGRVAGWDTE
jgi:hypothetical protein